jgi:hypothetical protein
VNEQKNKLQQTQSQSQSKSGTLRQTQTQRLRLTQGQEGEEAAQEDQPELMRRTAQPEWARTQPYEDDDEGAEGGWNHRKWVEEAVQKVMPGKAKKPRGRASSSVIPTQVYHLDRYNRTLAARRGVVLPAISIVMEIGRELVTNHCLPWPVTHRMMARSEHHGLPARAGPSVRIPMSYRKISEHRTAA